MSRKEITLEELKKIELDILAEIDLLCDKLNLRYSLTGGSLLGAVRHGGFIPWDDDIDILMPRPDYNKLIEYCKKNTTSFRLICNEIDERYSYLFAKAVNPDTIIVQENANRSGVELGVFVDIFPIDGLADTLDEAKKKFNASRFYRELLVAYNWSRFFRSNTRSWIYEPVRFAFFVMSRLVKASTLIKRIQGMYDEKDFEKYQYGGAICGAYRLREINTREVFSTYLDMDFEKHRFSGLLNYDEYLTCIYGDYMKLPPKEKQVTHHMFDAYWK